MKRIFRRRPKRSQPLLQERAEVQVAVGSLSGVAPSDIAVHVLLVVDTSGCMRVLARCCDYTALQVVTSAAEVLARRVGAAHAHGEEQ